MEDFQKRVVEEKDALVEKMNKLDPFLSTPTYANLPPDEQSRLSRQYLIMQLYAQVLEERISAF
jgi:hypothetical protein